MNDSLFSLHVRSARNEDIPPLLLASLHHCGLNLVMIIAHSARSANGIATRQKRISPIGGYARSVYQ